MADDGLFQVSRYICSVISRVKTVAQVNIGGSLDMDRNPENQLKYPALRYHHDTLSKFLNYRARAAISDVNTFSIFRE